MSMSPSCRVRRVALLSSMPMHVKYFGVASFMVIRASKKELWRVPPAAPTQCLQLFKCHGSRESWHESGSQHHGTVGGLLFSSNKRARQRTLYTCTTYHLPFLLEASRIALGMRRQLLRLMAERCLRSTMTWKRSKSVSLARRSLAARRLAQEVASHCRLY